MTQAWTTGRAHRLRRSAEILTLGGAVTAATLLGGSVLQRFATFQAGVASTEDPRYVVVPQRERLNART